MFWQEVISFKESKGKTRRYLLLVCFMSWVVISLVNGVVLNWAFSFDDVKLREGTTSFAWYVTAFEVVFLYPAIEELIFRLPLRFSRTNVTIAFLSMIIFFLFMPEIHSLFTILGSNFEVRVFGLFTILSGAFLVFRREKFYNNIKLIWEGHFKLVLLVFIILFALGHLMRFKIGLQSHYYVGIFIIGSYALSGIFLSYVRLKLGIGAAILFHMLNNSTPYLLALYYLLKTGENYFRHM